MKFDEQDIQKAPLSNKPAYIDADSMLYYLVGYYPPEDEESAMEEFKDAFVSLAKDIQTAVNTLGQIYFFFSCSRQANFRLQFDPQYKALRSKQKKPAAITLLKDWALENFSNTINCTNVEADDAVAYYWRITNGECIISSPDKDVLKQLGGIHYDYRKKVFIETNQKDAERFRLLQTLAGDATDGIPGIRNVGMTKAQKMLTIDSLDCVIANYKLRGYTKVDALRNYNLVNILNIKDAKLDLETQTFTATEFYNLPPSNF